MLLVTYTQSCDERTDTDTGSSQVADLINLQAGVDLAGVSQDLID